jgi:hypothetical protein
LTYSITPDERRWVEKAGLDSVFVSFKVNPAMDRWTIEDVVGIEYIGSKFGDWRGQNVRLKACEVQKFKNLRYVIEIVYKLLVGNAVSVQIRFPQRRT